MRNERNKRTRENMEDGSSEGTMNTPKKHKEELKDMPQEKKKSRNV